MALKQKFSGDFSQLIKEHEKLLAAQIRQEGQLRNLKTTAVQTGNKQVSAVDKLETANRRAIKGVKDMAGQYISMHAALAGINTELERKERLELAARDASVRIAEAEADVVVNLGDAPREVKTKFIGRLEEISKDAGFQSKAPIMEAGASAVTATGGDRDLALDVVEAMAPLFKSNPDQLVPGSEAVADLATVSRMSAEDTAGLVLSTMAKARVRKLESFKNVAPAVAAGVNTQKNISPERAAIETSALFASLGQQVKDKDGAKTATAVAALSVALERNFEIDQAKFEKLTNAGVSIEDARKQSALSVAERLDFAQNLNERITDAINAGVKPAKADIAVRDDLLSTGFEIQFKPIVRDLLAGNDTVAARQFDATLPTIKADGDLRDRMADQLGNLTTNLKIADKKRRQEGLIESAQTTGEAAIRGQITSAYKEAIEKTGSDLFGSSIEEIGFNFSRSVRESMLDGEVGSRAIELLQTRERSIRQGSVFFGTNRTDEELTEKERADVDVIRQAVSDITDFQADLRSINKPAAPPATVNAKVIADPKAVLEPQPARPELPPTTLANPQPARPELPPESLKTPTDFPRGFGPLPIDDAKPIQAALRANTEAMNRMTAAMQQTATAAATPPPQTSPAENAVPTPTTGNAAAQSRVHDERD